VSLLASIAEISAWLVAVFLLMLQLIAFAVGYGIGNKQKARAGAQSESVGVVVGGMSALLAFVLALTLSFANTRYSERRAGTLAESNAIGTAWLRAEAIGGEHGAEIAKLIEKYAQARENFISVGRDRAKINDINNETNSLQSTIWGHLAVIARDQPTPITAALMASLNDMFDASTSERFAFELTLPTQLFWLLLVLTLICTASIGYQLGIRGSAQPILVLLLSVMWTSVIVTILDLASPRIGSFQTDISPYQWTRQSFQGGITIPPRSNRP